MSELIRAKARLAEGVETYSIAEVGWADEGRYFCRVSNEYGTKEAYVDVKMLGQGPAFMCWTSNCSRSNNL